MTSRSQFQLVAGSYQRSARGFHDKRSIDVRQHSHFRRFLQLSQNFISSGSGQFLALLVYPAGILFGLLGMAAAWMAFGWASRRTQKRPAVQAMTTFFYALATLAWIGAVTFGVSTTLPRHVSTPQPRWDPMWEWVGLSKPMVLVMFGCACALLALALAALPRLRLRETRRDAPA